MLKYGDVVCVIVIGILVSGVTDEISTGDGKYTREKILEGDKVCMELNCAITAASPTGSPVVNPDKVYRTGELEN